MRLEDVVIAGVGSTPFGRAPDATLKTLGAAAVAAALDDSGFGAPDVDVAVVGNAVGGSIMGQEMITGQVILGDIGITEIPVLNVENACATASSALHLAIQAVAAGSADVALALGVEKLTHPDKSVPLLAIGRAVDVAETYGDGGPSAAARSYFMDLYAGLALRYAERTGATDEDFARVAVKNNSHGRLNPLAQYGSELTVEEVLDSRMVVEPLRLLMCSPISDGAAAAIVTRRDRAPDVTGTVDVLASVIGSRSSAPDEATALARTARRAYETSGVGPEDLNLVEVHDAAAPAELIAYEDLGLCASGEGPLLLRSGQTALGGRLPVNASGGLTAKGHPIGATGLGQVYEVVQQLRDRAGSGRQIPGARLALTENAGGWVGDDNAAIAIHILGRTT